MAEIMYWEALQRAHDEEMARDPLVICMGEDIGVAGGTYKATKGLYEKYGPLRVMDTPISENGYTGLGIGASFLGVRPIIEIMSVNFAWLAMDQMFNSAAKVRYMSGGQLTAPGVFRSPGGTAHQLGRAALGAHGKSVHGHRRSARGHAVQSQTGLRSAEIRGALRRPGVHQRARTHVQHEGRSAGRRILPPAGRFRNQRVPATTSRCSATTSRCTGASKPPRFWPSSTASPPKWSTCTRSPPLDRAGIKKSVCKTHRAVIAEEDEAPGRRRLRNHRHHQRRMLLRTGCCAGARAFRSTCRIPTTTPWKKPRFPTTKTWSRRC